MGTPDFAVAPLRRLVEGGYNIVGVVTMPDKPAGRGLKMQQSAVKQYATQAGLNVLQPEKLKADSFVEQFKLLNADLAIVIAFRMLPEIIWSEPRFGTFNLHASLLPQYRGAAPINWAIINGETVTGVTTFMLNHEIDKGDVLTQAKVEITDSESAGSLHDKLMVVGTELVVETIEKIASGNVTPIQQGDFKVESLKSAPKIFKEDCAIDWSSEPQIIHNLVRGLSPYPAAWATAKNTEGTIVVKIYDCHAESSSHNNPPGTVLSDDKKYIKVACKGGYMYIDELQAAGKRRMTTEEFLRGFKGITSYTFE